MRNLNSIRVFVRVAETRSFSEAAKQLELTPSAVSKAITKLEGELRVKLLHRTTRSVSLTNDGESFFNRCVEVLNQIEEAVNVLRSNTTDLSGRLSVHMPMGFGQRVVVPALVRFVEKYPNLTLDVDLSNRNIDLVYESTDVVVHIGALPDTRLVARRLCSLQYVTCAAPAYLEKYGEPETPHQLTGHNCLSYIDGHTGHYRGWKFMIGGRPTLIPVSGQLNFNNSESLLTAVCAGAGIATLANFTVADAIRTGQIRPILSKYVTPGLPVSVTYLPSRNLSPKIRAFTQFLLELVANRPAPKPPVIDP